MAVTEIIQLGISTGSYPTALGPGVNEQLVFLVPSVEYDFVARTLYWHSPAAHAAITGKAYVLEDGYLATNLVGETPQWTGYSTNWNKEPLTAPVHIVRGRTYYIGFKTGTATSFSVSHHNVQRGFDLWWRTTNDPGGYPNWLDATYGQWGTYGWGGCYLTNEDRPLNQAMPSGLNI